MTLKQFKLVLAFLFSSIAFFSCSKKTNDANKTFKYWSGIDAPAEIELLDGQYYESPHFTKEYIMYLKFKPTKKWWLAYLRYNSITPNKNSWTIPDDAPNWFKPSENFIRYGRNDEFDQGSRYFCDTTIGICYIYEIQL